MSDGPSQGWVRRAIPAMLLVAVLAALLHIAPFWHVQSRTPDGVTFTGNVGVSPDFMQYRTWMRQTQVEGPVVSNAFLERPTPGYLPVFAYWAYGKIGAVLGVSPEFVYAYAGALFAGLLGALGVLVVRAFCGEGRRAWLVVGAVLLGGGAGGLITWAQRLGLMNRIDTLQWLIVGGNQEVPIFEQYRQLYIMKSLFDTHFSLIWLLASAGLVALYPALKRESAVWGIAAGALFGLTTLIHIYSGITLGMATLGILLMLRLGGALSTRRLLIGLSACVVAGFAAAWVVLQQRSSGVPMPLWREPLILPSTYFLGYTVQVVILAFGLRDYVRHGGFDARFLVGWALGCTILTLGGPYYPYATRGTVTLQIPLTIMAAMVLFERWPRPPRLAVAAMVITLIATPTWVIQGWLGEGYDETNPYVFLDQERGQVVDLLAREASRDDVMLASPAENLWLAPEYPGRHYVGHFFLTPDFDQRRERLNQFLLDDPQEQRAFLQEIGARWIWVGGDVGTAGFIHRTPTVPFDVLSAVPGVRVRLETSHGDLYEFLPAEAGP